MTTMRTIRATVAAARARFAASLAAAVHPVPVVGGLASPVFAGNAGDGTGRLFIVEQAGVIRVLQPGASTATTFLDIQARRSIAGGEQGLLGLAFHPQYSANGRFFVYYTRSGDGTIVIAEYQVSDDRERRRSAARRCC